ncbi:hypothetical protein RCOM_1309380 [Ricinus communis]|uniref:Uncharacterized protein n=1 Tax=Ricinus communis TaxID=3988 RepID=B9SLY0_RICCO|nr:hypothetical protein RCOM_1309380 [Ricinus communis]
MSAHYRSPLSYTVLLLESASDSIFYIFQTLQDCEDALSLFEDGSLKEGAGQNSKVFGITADAKKCINTHRDEFETKMSHDLSTSHILTGAFQDALKFIKSSISMLKDLYLVTPGTFGEAIANGCGQGNSLETMCSVEQDPEAVSVVKEPNPPPAIAS